MTDSVIMRIFEVRARPGRAAELREKLATTSVSVVAGKAGNLGHYFGPKSGADARDFIFVSIWRDLASVRANFGEHWERSFLPAGYAELIEHDTIEHFEVEGHAGT